MTSAKLLSPGLCKSGLRRYWPLWLAGFVALLLLFVLPAYVSIPMVISEGNDLAWQVDLIKDLWTMFGLEGWFYALVGSAIVALALNEHLFDSRAATFIGSLPLRRQAIFSSTYASGLLVLFALPALACLCLLPLRLATGPIFSLAYVGTWLLVTVALSFVFYSFAQLSCQVSGTRLVALLIYLVIGFLAVCLEAAIRLLISALVYGLNAYDAAFDWLSPAAHLASVVISPLAEGISYQGSVLREIAPYALAACVATGLSMWLFTRRNLESAGDGVLFAPLRKVLKYLAGISLGLLFGTIYRLLSVSDAINGLPMATGDLIVLVALLSVGAFLGALFADMIMSRSTHVLGSCWREGVVLVCVMLAFVGACKTDLFHAGRYVPEPGKVEAVALECDYGSDELKISSPEGVAAVCELQQNLINYGGKGDSNQTSFTIRMTYQLEGGRTVRRAYPIVTDFPISLTSDGEDSQLLSEFARIADSDEGRASRFADILGLDGNAEVQVEYLADDGTYSSFTLSREEADEFVKQALSRDLMEERVGELFFDMTDENDSGVAYDANVYVTKLSGSQESDYQPYLASPQLSEEGTPHTLSWLREHYPNVELKETEKLDIR